MAERKRRIPRFTSYEQEAAFWDSHSLAEFADELEVVENLRVARPLKHRLSVPLDASTLAELAAMGAQIGVHPSALARQWIIERLRQERDAHLKGGEPTAEATSSFHS